MVLSWHIMGWFLKKCWSGSDTALTLWSFKGDCKIVQAHRFGSGEHPPLGLWKINPSLEEIRRKCLASRVFQSVLIVMLADTSYYSCIDRRFSYTSSSLWRIYYAHACCESWWATVGLSPFCLLLVKDFILTPKVETLWRDLERLSQTFHSAWFSITRSSRHSPSQDKNLINILRFLFGY